jgi:type II secretory pathway pseudopilin PulG
MRLIATSKLTTFLMAARRRAASESGFTMVVALGALAVTSLLIAAVFVAVNGDIHQSTQDLASQQAYAAARAGENAFLYQLNQNPNYWTTCANDYQPTPVAVPGAVTNEKYSFTPVYNSGYTNTNCTTTNAIAAMVDPITATLRMKFTGYAGNTNSSGVPAISRTIVTSFKKPSPLDYLWYTDHEMKDPMLDSGNCTGEKYYWQYGGSVPSAVANNCEINWISGDTMSGPSYTNDQYLVYTSASPTFGRSGTKDQTQSSAPTSSVCVNSNCQKATFQGTTPASKASAKSVQLPSTVSSTQLLNDAQNSGQGQVFTGTTTINLTGTTATISNCPGTATGTACTSGWLSHAETLPSIIYVQSASGCPSTYSLNTAYATNSSGQYYGACGDVYVHGNYTQPLTIVSDHDIIIVANNGTLTPGITTNVDASGNPTGNSTLGLVAGDFVRVMHSASTNSNAITIDAAILTLAHSFMVDNYNSGGGGQPGLTVHGAIAQRYRGIVGTTTGTGYIKDYHYDDRLHVILPPFLFDLSTAGWNIIRETLCMTTGNMSASTSCTYQGS